MKEIKTKAVRFLNIENFISHMVQMKEKKGGKMENSEIRLYIPHGSDESCAVYLQSIHAFDFISHMVQMKDQKLFM